jgi:SAM-dependent methyltransferase
MAGSYEDEIFSVFHSDADGLIVKRLKKIAKTAGTVADVGCGIGHFLPLVSDLFDRVYANDISGDLLARAERNYSGRGNIIFLPGDICSAFREIPRVHCVLSVNSLISSSEAVRARMLGAMAHILKPGGMLVLVVPSLESVLLTQVRFVQWHIKDGLSSRRAWHAVYGKDPEAGSLSLRGIVPIEGVLTKHFLKEELEVLLSERGLAVTESVKIPYGWDTEFESPPRWMKAPYPWDWLIVARKSRKR